MIHIDVEGNEKVEGLQTQMSFLQAQVSDMLVMKNNESLHNQLSTMTSNFNRLVSWTESVLDLSFTLPKYTLMRFEIKKVRGQCPYGGCVQLSQILFENNGRSVNLSDAKASSIDSIQPKNEFTETPEKALTSYTDGKWCSTTWNTSLIIKLSKPTAITGFGFITGNDYPERDPVCWRLQGSNNGTNWVTLHKQMVDYPVPINRHELTGMIRFDSLF